MWLFANILKRLNGETMMNVRILLEDLCRLGRMDGYALHQFQCVEDDYDAERWFESISEIAKKYDIEIPDYENYDPWEKAVCLNIKVEDVIKDKIYQLIK